MPDALVHALVMTYTYIDTCMRDNSRQCLCLSKAVGSNIGIATAGKTYAEVRCTNDAMCDTKQIMMTTEDN